MDKDGKVTNMFNKQVTARFIRIIPVDGAPNGMALRMNFIGCFHHATMAPNLSLQGIPTPGPDTPPTIEPGTVACILLNNYRV